MLKKMLIFCSIVLGVIIVSQFVILENNKKILADNPYEKDELHPKTIEQLKDNNYKNIILPQTLKHGIDDKEDHVIYFYTSTCTFCKKTTPLVVPMAEELGLDLKLFNLLEFEEGWDEYKIDKTPTIVYFKDGKEVNRTEGLKSESEFKDFLAKTK